MEKKGFTLMELLLVIGILVIATALSLPFFSSFQTRTDLRTQNDYLAQSLRLAQSRAISGFQGLNWGIYFDEANNKYILYGGPSYAGRTEDLDLETSYPSVYDLSADFGNEINFASFSGLPSVNGTTTFSGPTEVEKHTTINNLGLIFPREN